jgi:hypothetical protein
MRGRGDLTAPPEVVMSPRACGLIFALAVCLFASWLPTGAGQGAKPADLPVEQPTRFEPVVNLKTAEALRCAIPESILLRADQTRGEDGPR